MLHYIDMSVLFSLAFSGIGTAMK